MKKKGLAVFLIIISFSMIGFGVYLINLGTYKSIISKTVDGMFNDLKKTFVADYSYNSLNNIGVTTDISINTNSLKENIGVFENEKLRKFLTVIYNMNGSVNKITYERDLDNKRMLFKYNIKVKDKEYDGKYLVDNSTSYYYLKDYTKKYVNDGSNNYFESISNDDKDNFSYVTNYIKEALKKQLLESSDDIVETKVNQKIGDSSVECNKVSISLDSKRIKIILNKIHDSLVKDNRSNYVISNYYKDFSNYKFDNSKVSNFILNIYTYDFDYKLAKLEIKFVIDKDNYLINYEYGKDNINNGSIVKNDALIYSFTDTIQENSRIINLKDKNYSDCGKITISNKKDDFNINLDIKKDDKNIILDYSSKVKVVKENKVYEKSRHIYFNLLDQKEFSFEINTKSDINSFVDIEEDISEAIMKSSLTDDEKKKIDGYKDDILNYLES